MPEPPEPKHHQLVSPGLEESLRHQEQPIVRTRPTTHTAEAESETCYSRPLIAAAWSRHRYRRKDQNHNCSRFPLRSGDADVLVSILPGFDHLRSRLPASSWAIRSNNCFAAGSPGSTGFRLAFASFEVMGIHCGALYFFFRRSWEFGAA